MLLVAGASLPRPLAGLAGSPGTLVRHLQTFAVAGLKAAGKDYRARRAG